MKIVSFIGFQKLKNEKLLTGYSEFPYKGTYGDVREPIFSDLDYLGDTYRVVATKFIVFEGTKERRLNIMLAQSQKIQKIQLLQKFRLI